MAQTAPPRPAYPVAAKRNYLASALIAQRAAREARKATSAGTRAVARVIIAHQQVQAVQSIRAVSQILAEQDIAAKADAILNSSAFATELEQLTKLLDATLEERIGRLAESLVQDSGRAAESVAVAVRANVVHVRYLSPPSCVRCAILANRIYRWSAGFKRHPNCDCVMVPTTVANADYYDDVHALVRSGQVTGLSKADLRAVTDGADLAKIVNIRRDAAGLNDAGRGIARAGKPTPEGIYRMSSTREQAVELLARYGYVTT